MGTPSKSLSGSPTARSRPSLAICSSTLSSPGLRESVRNQWISEVRSTSSGSSSAATVARSSSSRAWTRAGSRREKDQLTQPGLEGAFGGGEIAFQPGICGRLDPGIPQVVHRQGFEQVGALFPWQDVFA